VVRAIRYVLGGVAAPELPKNYPDRPTKLEPVLASSLLMLSTEHPFRATLDANTLL